MELFDKDEDVAGSQHGAILNVNEDYAKRFNYNKQREELHRLKDKYGGGDDQYQLGDGDSNDSSSEDEDEDDDAMEITADQEAQVLKTIAAIRTRDSAIYDPSHQFFQSQSAANVDASNADTSVSQQKPLLLADYHKERLLHGELDDSPEQVIITHEQEQRQIKDNLIKAIAVEDPEDDLLVVKPKSIEQTQQEDDQYNDWVLPKIKDDKNAQKVFNNYLASGGGEKKAADEDDQFLLDYVFNKGWQEKSDRRQTPKYLTLTEQDEEDFERDDQDEEFETKFNFRFEELEQKMGVVGSSYTQTGKALVNTYARQQPESVRKVDSHRADQRRAKEERLRIEKELKINELKRLKQLKRKEMEEMCQQVLKISGLDKEQKKRYDKKVQKVIEKLLDDGESEFNPDKFSQLMSEVFDDEYYEQVDKTRPDFSDESDIDMDADHLENSQPAASSHKKRKLDVEQESTGTDNVSGEGEDDSATQKLRDLLKEYDDLYYEDIKGGLKTRFKYKQVDQDTYGLDASEILEADDDILNDFVSLKKLAPYRADERFYQWQRRFKRKSKHKVKEFRRKLQERLEEKQKQQKSHGGSQSDKKKRSKDLSHLKVVRDSEPVPESANNDTEISQKRLSAYNLK
ncbi:hypothetical protein MIR68_003931 [Amoeboaphelidium protococcarum]|nr:hypothetical protein MIR68_003931 [Amoeboaphelidium protococcarum]